MFLCQSHPALRLCLMARPLHVTLSTTMLLLVLYHTGMANE
jgi:hypothetical protein